MENQDTTAAGTTVLQADGGASIRIENDEKSDIRKISAPRIQLYRIHRGPHQLLR